MNKFTSLLVALSCSVSAVFAQGNDLMDMLDKTDPIPKKKEEVTATFKATRIINGSSVQNLAGGVLDFRISHRFGRLDQGIENFLGLDNATTKIGLDYGVTNWLMVGLAHSAFNKENDGFVKVRLLKQKKAGTPITLTYFGATSIQTMPAPVLSNGETWYFSNRMYFTNQLLIARKFSDKLSLQLTPTLVHYNLVDSTKFSNNTLAIGVGGRIKLSKRLALTGEYYYRVTNADLTFNAQPTYNSLSLGLDIETGGHVFQLLFTNSQGMTERTYIGQTTDTWEKGAIHFGFNVSRVFTVVKPKEFRKSADKKEW
jgi:hypothetical protein